MIRGKYLLERELARGGMGAVWIALDTQLQRRVALKRIGAELSGSQAAHERFRLEAMAIARLTHANVVQIYDYGIDGGSPYIAMELLEGEDLGVRLEREGKLSLAALAPIVTAACRALAAAHAASIIHRDLKPGNLFLVRGGAQETVKVLDFGIASLGSDAPGGAAERAVVRRAIIGTPPYMSPEQARGRATDARSDLWSLAVIAYQALTGRRPFTSRSLSDLVAAICMDPIEPPSQIVPGLPPEVDWFFARALERLPDDRFQTAKELGAAFAALAEAGRSQRTGKLLFVDDEADHPLLVRRHFREELRSGAYEIEVAADGEEALDRLRRGRDIDVIVTDIRMPRMDGLLFLSKVAEINPMAKVVMMSAFGDMGNVRRAMNEGAFDFLTKPVDVKDLRATIERALERVREARERRRAAEENEILRQFVQRAVYEEVVPLRRRTGDLVCERVEGTFVFVEVAGLAAGRPAEEIAATLNLCLGALVAAIDKHGGQVESFRGDGLCAVFLGAAHGERAIAAVVAARSWARQRLLAQMGDRGDGVGVRAGLESGDAVRAVVGATTNGRLSLTVVGAAVRTAAALSRAARLDQILLGPALRSSSVDGTGVTVAELRVRRGGDEDLAAYEVRGAKVQTGGGLDGTLPTLIEIGEASIAGELSLPCAADEEAPPLPVVSLPAAVPVHDVGAGTGESAAPAVHLAAPGSEELSVPEVSGVRGDITEQGPLGEPETGERRRA